ncbi:MAG: thioredoxin TrxC [Burkholderiales bacterium]
MRIVCPNCLANNHVPPQRLEHSPNCGRCKKPLFTGHPQEVSDATLQDVLTGNDIPVVLDCWAPWCGPCNSFAPIFNQAARTLEPHVWFVKLNTDAYPGPSSRLSVRSVPTLIAFKGGQEIARTSGALPLQQFVQWVKRLL